MDSHEYPPDFSAMMRINELERRVKKLEDVMLKPCSHLWKVNKRGDMPAVFFSGTNSCMVCSLCGHREKC